MSDPEPVRKPIFRFPLTGDAETMDDLAGPAPRSREDVEAAAARYGTLRVRRAALWSAVRQLQDRSRTAGYPPRIFLSYRWEDEEIKQWCRELAAFLRGRGYEVLLDLENLADDVGPAGIGIADYVARLVDVQLALRVITAPYVGSLLREWLLAEDQLMKLMAETGCVIAHLLLRDGAEPPDWGRHGVVDLRDDPQDFARLDAILPPYTGPTLPSETDLVDVLARGRDLLAERRPDAALDLIRDRGDLLDTFEVRQLLAHIWLAMDKPQGAVQAARSIEQLPGRPTVETTIDVALILEEARLPRDALRVIIRVIMLPTSLQPRIRRMAGSLLEDAGAPEAGLRHLRYALTLPDVDPLLRADLHNLAGHTLLFSLGDADAALVHFAAGAAEDPGNQHLVTNQLVGLMTAGRSAEAQRMAASWRGRPDLISPLHRVIAAIAGGVDVRAPIIRSQVRSATHACTGCGSAFRLDRGFALCSVCASTALAGPRCPFCSVTRWSPLGLSADRAACPICREAMIIPEPTARLW